MVFEHWVSVAKERELPLALHIVSAHGDAIELLRKYSPVSGFVHGYSGSAESAKVYLDLGLHLSVGPAVLNPKFKKLRQVFENKDLLSRLLLETDQPESPQSPDPYSEQLLFDVAAQVAESMGLEASEVIDKTSQNFLQLASG